LNPACTIRCDRKIVIADIDFSRKLRILWVCDGESRMKTYTSLDLQQRTGDIQRAAVVEPVLITSHGRPRMIISSVEEFVRLKEASGEPVPEDVLRERKAIERRGLPADPLGYDTSDMRACALAMAEAALSGRNRPFVEAEIAAVEKRLLGAK
jgi:PHD/YefM family antitoxin component YafN of YafNO toxin-antitoxin module